MQRLLNLQSELVGSDRIDAQAFKLILFGPNYKQRERGFQVLRDNNMLDHHHLTEANKQEIRYRTFHIVAKAYKNSQFKLEDIESNPNKGSLYGTAFPYYDLGMSVRGGVHTYLYAKSIFLLGTEKHRELLERTITLKDYGCFALTELTHGSNVKGILTEAHYDHSTREFVINSPSKNAMKFWIGGAAETANMSVVWAQLYINGKSHGVHAYVVPIRDPLTHKLLPGVLVGDCGPKSGLNGIDNGFLLFDKVRIPVGNQLDRISGVDEKGQFKTIIKNDQKRFGLHLAALSGGRYMIAVHCCTVSLQALTIAVRYCHERRQFKLPGKTQQTLLIDYPLTKRRLMPLLGQTIVYIIASMTNVFYWDENQKNIFDPTHPTIQNLHAISSVMKAMTSWFASECVRECREQMGAHGYSSYSKLGTLYNDNDINLTWEGDNHVLIQQTTKYVMQQAQKIMQKGQKTNNRLLQFLADPPQTLPAITRLNLLDLSKGVEFLQYKLAKKVEETGLKMFELQQQKLSLMEIWNGAQVFLGREVALAYGNLSILTTAIEAISKCSHTVNRQVIQTSTILWMLIVYRKEEFVDLIHRPIIEQLISQQCAKLAPYDLQILRAISVDDDIIGSPFADPNGKGIQKYLKMLTSRPTNQRPQWWDIYASR